MNILIVDVANCFISNGSFDFHKLNQNKLDENYKQIKEISNLIDNNNIVFTRDFHPHYHSSLAYEENNLNFSVTYSIHCRNTNRACFNKPLPNKKNNYDTILVVNVILKKYQVR